MVGGDVGTVVLAAGAASRFGGPKQKLLLPSVLAAASAAGLTDVVVVEGAHALDDLDLAGTRLVRCSDWAIGPGASLRAGLGALNDEVETALVLLADGPHLDPRAIARILDHRTDAPLIAATYDGTRSHPLAVARSLWTSIPDPGLRALRAALIDCSDLDDPGDIDTPDLLPESLR
jgi:CTP:molybdopterin cytidylyltransferase MocA